MGSTLTGSADAQRIKELSKLLLSGQALRRAVLEVCRIEFLHQRGRAWRTADRRSLVPRHIRQEHECEWRAIDALKALREAFRQVLHFDRGLPKRGEGTAGFLNLWRSEHRNAIFDAFEANPVPRLDGGPVRRKLRVRNLVVAKLRDGWVLGGKRRRCPGGC